jgi:hypothetical protein
VAVAASRGPLLLDGDCFGEGVLRRSSSGTSRDFGGGVDGRAGGSGVTWSPRGRGGTGGGRDATDAAFDGMDVGTALEPSAGVGSVYRRMSAAASRARFKGISSSYFRCVQFCRLSAKPAEEPTCSPHCAGESPFVLIVGALKSQCLCSRIESGGLALPCPAGPSRLTGRAVSSD